MIVFLWLGSASYLLSLIQRLEPRSLADRSRILRYSPSFDN
jgi:hypothetical protein